MITYFKIDVNFQSAATSKFAGPNERNSLTLLILKCSLVIRSNKLIYYFSATTMKDNFQAENVIIFYKSNLEDDQIIERKTAHNVDKTSFETNF